jgi:hypothetical protein
MVFSRDDLEAPMNEPCMVEWCDRPVGDGYTCQRCADRLSVALGDVPALWEQLDIVLTRQARYSDPEGRGGEKALPYNLKASELGTALRGLLNTWCRLIAEERGKDLPTDTPAAVACWLLNHVTWLRHHRAGSEAVEELVDAVNSVRRIVDRPAERIYAGPCVQCGGDMYGKPGAEMVECRPCGVGYEVAGRVAWMKAQVYGRLVTAREGSILLSRFGLPTQQKTIDKWFERNRLVPHSKDADPVRLYLFDDLVALAAASAPAERAS